MKRFISLTVVLIAVSLPLIGSLVSCQQGEGQRCQVQSDCKDGLQCNVGEGVCRSMSSDNEDIDAMPPPDAPPDAM